MSQFEFFMTFYGLMLGLGVAQLLQGFGDLLRERQPPRWGVLTPLLGVLIFIQVISAFADAWFKLKDVSLDFRGLAAPALVGVSYFVAALMAVPRDAADWPSLDDYFHARKKFTLGALLVGPMLTIAFFEVPKILSGEWPHTAAFLIPYVSLAVLALGLIAAPLFTRRTRPAAAALIASAALIVIFYATDFPILPYLVGLLGG